MTDALETHREAYAYCAYCPKMCRFACPVSAVTRNEATSTWGKMSAAYLTAESKRPLDAGNAELLYACTGCMRCRTFCKHENEVGWALSSARQAAVESQVEPAGARSTLRTWSQHQNPFGRDLSEIVARYRADAPIRYALFPGCSSLVKRPELVEDALACGEALAAPFGVSRASARCCGYPLYAAGDHDAFVAHARKVSQALASYPELVILDPGCAYTFTIIYPRMGVEVSSRLRTVVEVLAEHLDHAPERPKSASPVAYHDACHLGRGLGQYDAPRALLRAAVGEFREAREVKEEAGCSGGGGLLPRTMPAVSVEVAREQAEATAPEGVTVVTGCPTARRMFERSGRTADDLLSVLRSWLAPA